MNAPVVPSYSNLIRVSAADEKVGPGRRNQPRKAVFQAEYKLPPTHFCPADEANGFNGVQFDLNLDGRRFRPCA